MTFYHFTCAHGRAAMGDEARLVPGADQSDAAKHLWMARWVWLTDLSSPLRDALGLTSHFITCDRTAHRYRVTDDSSVTEWWRIARAIPRAWREELESSPGAMPRHWFVSALPVPAVYDPVRIAVAR